MAIIQVAREGTKFVVQEDGVTIPHHKFEKRGEAVAAALKYKENN